MKNRTRKLLSLFLTVAMVLTLNSFALADNGADKATLTEESENTEQKDAKPGEEIELGGWRISENGEKCSKSMSLNDSEIYGKKYDASIFVEKSDIDLTIYGSTDLDYIGLNFFDASDGKPYKLSTDVQTDHLVIDMALGETGNSFMGQTYVAIPFRNIDCDFSKDIYDRITFDSEGKSDIDEKAYIELYEILYERLKGLIEVREDYENIYWNYALDIYPEAESDKNRVGIVFVECNQGMTEATLRGWTVKDSQARWLDNGESIAAVNLYRESRQQYGECFCAHMAISENDADGNYNPVDTVITGTTGLTQLRIDMEDGMIKTLEDGNYYFCPRVLNKEKNDKITLDVSRSESFKKDDKSEVLIPLCQFADETEELRDSLVFVKENPGVEVKKEKTTVSWDNLAIDGDHDFWKYTFTVVDTQEEKNEESMSKNEACNPDEKTVEGGYKVSYNSFLPYFGKKLTKDEFKKMGIKVTVDGVEYDAVAGKIVRLKDAEETVSNASIVITKLEGGTDPKARKKAQKWIKKNTKPKKGQLGALPVRIYAYRLNDQTAAGLNGLTVKGKAGKYSIACKLGGKKVSLKNGKKDSFGKAVKVDFDKSKKELAVSCNDIQGTAAGDAITDKTK